MKIQHITIEQVYQGGLAHPEKEGCFCLLGHLYHAFTGAADVLPHAPEYASAYKCLLEKCQQAADEEVYSIVTANDEMLTPEQIVQVWNVFADEWND